MGKHFNLMEFLRKVPRDLLQIYCSREGILTDFSWGHGKKMEAAALIGQALAAEGRAVSDRVTIHFRNIWDIAGLGFTHGALNEARFFKDTEAYGAIKRLKSHLSRAFWTTLERPQYVKKARILADIDQLPDGAWVRRSGLPARPGPVDDAVVAALEAGVIDYFTRTEHRGGNCKIDPIRRDGEEIFFVYAEDHPDTELVWQSGQLEPQAINPAFRLIFRHYDERRILDIFVQGDRRKIPALQQLFAKIVLGEEIELVAPIDNFVYDLDRVLMPGFDFEFSLDLGITEVRAVKMRFVLEGEPWRRILVEADNAKVRDALSSFVSDVTRGLPDGRAVLDQLHLKVRFEKREDDKRAPMRDCIITSPNLLRLKKDDLGEKIEEMLFQSGIERRDAEDDS